jgi:hypothetical protein
MLITPALIAGNYRAIFVVNTLFPAHTLSRSAGPFSASNTVFIEGRRAGENLPQHGFEFADRQGFGMGVKRRAIVQFTKLGCTLEVGMGAELLTQSAIYADLVK